MSATRGTRAFVWRSVDVLYRSACVVLCVALTISLTAFLVGGPFGKVEQQELGQQDRASDASDTPNTWLGRSNQRANERAVDSKWVWISAGELEPLAANLAWIEPPLARSLVARTVDRWRATPVRGPPAAMPEC